MRIVLFNWRDSAHPKAGGAEFYTDALLSVLSQLGHACTLFTSSAAGLEARSFNGRYEIIRAGSELTCRFFALQWLIRNKNHVDLVIDEVNTLPFFSRFVLPEKTILLMHQLAREVWWKEAPLPIAAFGYLAEPLFLQVYRSIPVITISNSSRESFRQIGLARECHVIECPLAAPETVRSNQVSGYTVGYVGRVNPSKRVEDLIRAFSLVLTREPHAVLRIVGQGPLHYMRRLEALTRKLKVSSRVEFLGRVSNEERDRLMASFDVLAMASVREGWGLVVSEAARFGVPTVAYDVPGLRDSIRDGVSGILVRSGHWQELGNAIDRVLRDPSLRNKLGAEAARYLQSFSTTVFSQKVKSLPMLMPKSGCR